MCLQSQEPCFIESCKLPFFPWVTGRVSCILINRPFRVAPKAWVQNSARMCCEMNCCILSCVLVCKVSTYICLLEHNGFSRSVTISPTKCFNQVSCILKLGVLCCFLWSAAVHGLYVPKWCRPWYTHFQNGCLYLMFALGDRQSSLFKAPEYSSRMHSL